MTVQAGVRRTLVCLRRARNNDATGIGVRQSNGSSIDQWHAIDEIKSCPHVRVVIRVVGGTSGDGRMDGRMDADRGMAQHGTHTARAPVPRSAANA